MSDLEMVKLCAEAMDIPLKARKGARNMTCGDHDLLETEQYVAYDPLHDDAQAMQLVKRFWLAVYRYQSDKWCAQHRGQFSDNRDLNRAICECVAKMQASVSRSDNAPAK